MHEFRDHTKFVELKVTFFVSLICSRFWIPKNKKRISLTSVVGFTLSFAGTSTATAVKHLPYGGLIFLDHFMKNQAKGRLRWQPTRIRARDNRWRQKAFELMSFQISCGPIGSRINLLLDISHSTFVMEQKPLIIPVASEVINSVGRDDLDILQHRNVRNTWGLCPSMPPMFKLANEL